jgi:Tol biopolymer transport system component
MELLDGPTLADLIEGPMPIDKALSIALQIADALGAAHQRGVVHRDLKPANIKVDHRVKVLDFGLAKVLDPEQSTDLSTSPTITGAATRAGVILGTAAYMSPEQAKGRIADAQADVWAFGVVLFEMLTGKPPFTGESAIEVLGGVIKDEPVWTLLPPSTPATLTVVLRRCLQKDVSRRFRDIRDVRVLIEELIERREQFPAAIVRTSPRRRLVLGAAVVGALAGAIAATSYAWVTREAPDELRVQIATGTGDPNAFAMSPDGASVVYQGTVRGRSGLWLQPLNADTPRELAPNGGSPFWSAHGDAVGFQGGGGIYRVGVAGGTPRLMATVVGPRGGTWNSDDVVLIGQTGGPLLRVSANGGSPGAATSLLPAQTSHRGPHFLPDGHHFLFYATGTADVRGLHIGDLNSKSIHRLTDADTSGVFLPPSFVLYARQSTLYAQALNIDAMALTGNPSVVAENIELGNLTLVGRTAQSASGTGRIAYRTATKNTVRQLTWFDRTGRALGTVGEPDAYEKDSPRLSPDGRYVLVCRNVDGNADVYRIETDRGAMGRLTRDSVFEGRPAWSPRGNEFVFNSYQLGKTDLYRMSPTGTTAEPVLATAGSKDPWDWSKDDYILYNDIANGGIWAYPVQGGRKPILINARGQGSARFSPDGKWVAYQSGETGRGEIYLQSFPDGRVNLTVSTNGGRWPEWRKDGGELYYVEPDDTIVAVRLTPRGDTIDRGQPAALFRPRIQPPRWFSSGTQYTVAPDGQRFLVNALVGEGETVPLTIVLNWRPPR